MDFIKRVLGIGTTVDAILSDFHKLTARLRNAIDFHTNQVAFHNEAIAAAEELKIEAQAEADRAAKVVANIEKMIGLD